MLLHFFERFSPCCIIVVLVACHPGKGRFVQNGGEFTELPTAGCVGFSGMLLSFVTTLQDDTR